MNNIIFTEMMDLQHTLVGGCNKCGSTGYLPPVSPGEVNPCVCMKIHSYVCDLIESTIPRNYWWLDLEGLEVAEEYKKFIIWFITRLDKAVTNGLGILFMGANGIGKTSMQCAIGKEAVVQGFKVRYYTAQQYLEAKKSKDENKIKDMESAQIILLDELDKVYISKGSNYVMRTLEDYLRRMTSEGKSLIICTNGDEDYLKKTFGDSTLSALNRHLKYINVDGDDYSNKLQDRWKSIMGDNLDWYNPAILKMAERRADRIAEEDRREWEKICRR